MISQKHTFFLYGLFSTLLFILPIYSFAQSSDNFTISSVVGSDSIPPTIPANFSVTPVSTTQIDLAWNASSDNVSVGGYQVFRDATQIATTTLVSFSDTGLSASTSYTYYIIAFDTAFNYATPTASLATSTLALTPTSTPTTTPPSTGGGGGPSLSLLDIEIQNLVYDTTQNSIILTYDTNVRTQSVIRWGRTSDFEGGYVASDAFSTSHHTIISGLSPGTVYELEIQLMNSTNERKLTRHLRVTTQSGADITPPPNVTDFTAWRTIDTARLSWTNPDVADFSHVRVLSSDFFYPTHPADGWLVYEGSGESVRDSRVIPKDSARYYSIFAYDDAGNTSSGAVAYVQHGSPRVTEVPQTPATSTPLFVPPQFTFNDITFMQQDKVHKVKENIVTLDGAQDTIISIPYELLPEHLKTVVMTLKEPGERGKTFSFLLRINPDKTAYESHIGALAHPGEYEVSVAVFDFSTRELFTTAGTLLVEESSLETVPTGVHDSLRVLIARFVFFILFLMLLFLWYLFFWKKRKEDTT